MSVSQLIITVIEVLLIVAVIVGFMYEPIVAEWEQKQKEKVLKAFKKMKEYRND